MERPFDMRKKKKNPYSQESFYSAIKNENLKKKHTTINNLFLLLFQCNSSLCFNALNLKASSLAFVHFFLHVFLFL